MTETTILDESAVSEIENRAGDKWTVNTDTIRALCATVKHLRELAYVPKILPDDDEVAYRDQGERLLREKIDLQSQFEQLRAERDALRDSASVVAFQAHQIDGKIAESLIAQGETALRSRVLELCKSKAAECEREAENADMRLRSSERDVIENEARAIKELAVELEKL